MPLRHEKMGREHIPAIERVRNPLPPRRMRLCQMPGRISVIKSGRAATHYFGVRGEYAIERGGNVGVQRFVAQMIFGLEPLRWAFIGALGRGRSSGRWAEALAWPRPLTPQRPRPVTST